MDGCKIFMVASLIVFTIMGMTSMVIQKTTFSLTRGVTKSNNKALTTILTEPIHQKKIIPQPTNVSSQQFLEGLFAPGTDKESCLSRFESSLLRKPSKHKPSPYLIYKLRHYEALHRRCGPYTLNYNETIEHLKSGRNGTVTTPTECRYIVYTALSGLGNRMLTIASTFLYALLTNRVLLVQFGPDSSNLFCEPFPNSTWLLPSDFPLNNEFGNINQEYPRTYGNLMKKKMMNISMVPSFLFLYLAYNIDRFDSLFYCKKNQKHIQNVPWLIITSNQYFVPALFQMPRYKKELGRMFPDKETVFHNLGHYLFQPSNDAWGLISRFYQAYLAKADQRIGIQVRVFDDNATAFRTVMDQILDCTIKKNVLPDVGSSIPSLTSIYNQKFKAILVTSLYSSYYEYVKEMYWTKPTRNGDMVGVYQPSHEEYEQFGSNMHTMKAWSEINLLSMSDVLVTSSWSTFGYVAQGLGGLKPWILYRPVNETVPNPSCLQAMSMEPCFHFPPRFRSCGANKNFDEAVSSHLKNCEDVGWGLKLVNTDD